MVHRRALGASHHTIFRMIHTIFRMIHTIFRMINGRYALPLRAWLPFAKVARKRASSGSGADSVDSRFGRNGNPRLWAASDLS